MNNYNINYFVKIEILYSWGFTTFTFYVYYEFNITL